MAAVLHASLTAAPLERLQHAAPPSFPHPLSLSLGCWSKGQPQEQRCSLCRPACELVTVKEGAEVNIDVSAVFVDTAFRSTPWEEEALKAQSQGEKARLLFVSESNVCRSVLAEAYFRRAAEEAGLSDFLEVATKGTRDYNEGEGPDASVLAVAEEAGLKLPIGHTARQFDPAKDIVHNDLVLVMDKFTAADVLREVSVYDTINSAGGYTRRVRRLGEFHPDLAPLTAPEAQDLGDPLYGNLGGEEEKEAVRQSALEIEVACKGLVAYLQRLKQDAPQGVPLRETVTSAVQQMAATPWLVPPMLSSRG